MKRLSTSWANFIRIAPLALGLACIAVASKAQGPAQSASARYQIFKSAVDHWFEARPDTGALAAASASPMTNGTVASTIFVGTTTSSATIVFTGDLDTFDVDPSTDASDAHSLDEEMLRLAQTMGLLRAQLKSAGYPEGIYEGPVSQFESRGIRALTAGQANPINNTAAIKGLVAEIDENRAATDPNLPAVKYVYVAYASYVRPVILRSKPTGGRVWLITQLRFEVCRLSLPDPYDLNTCRQWREADAENPMYISGTYAYQVLWKNGRKAVGQRTIYNDRGDSPVVYVLP